MGSDRNEISINNRKGNTDMEPTLQILNTISVDDTDVVYRGKTYRTLSITPQIKNQPDLKHITRYKPTFLRIYAINEDGKFEILNDETWCFEFKKKRKESRKKWLSRKRKKASR